MIETAELRSGYVVPRIIKGGWQLAGGHGAFDRKEAIAGMRAFCDAGLTAFDFADIYTGVESLIGEFVTEGGKPQVFAKLVPDLDRLENTTRADLDAIVDRSLARLKMDRLDHLQFFWWDMNRGDPVGVLSSLMDLQAKGKIGHLGTTNFDQTVQARFVEAGMDLVSAQVQYSLLDNRPAGAFSQWCEDNHVHLLCYGSLAGGFFSDTWLGKLDPGYAFENRSLIKYRLIIDEFGGWALFQELLGEMQRIATKHNVDIAAVAARWVLDQPQVAAVIIGAKTAAHLERNLRIFSLRLDAEDLGDLALVREKSDGPKGAVYALESDRAGRHGRIMKYNLGST